MKVSSGCNVKKYADLEGGGGDKPIEILVSKSLKSSRCFNVIKFIFYLEIILFIGLLGFMALQTYFERSRFSSSSVNEELNRSNDFDPAISIITSTTEATDDSKESQDIYESPLLQEMTNKIQKLVDAIDKLSESDNSERELSKYREVFKPFLSNENTNDNSHENYNSRVLDIPVITGSDVLTASDSDGSASSQSYETTQQPIGRDFTTKSFPLLVDDVDNHDVVPILKYDDVFPIFEAPESSEEPLQDFGIAASFEESSIAPGDNQDDVSEVMIETNSQAPFVDVSTNDRHDSGMSENYSSSEVVCDFDEINVDKLRNLGHSFGFSIPDMWSHCVDADDAFALVLRQRGISSDEYQM